MKISVKAQSPKDNKQTVTMTVDKADVDAAVAAAYKDIANRYNFQGFRRGRTPRPVIDGMVGREAVLAQATNAILSEAEPLMLDELDVVPLTEPSYGDEPALVEEGSDYVAKATLELRPQAKLSSYDAPAIELPPAEATDAEVSEQINQLQSYRTTYEDVDENRAVVEGDVLSIDIDNIEGAESLAGKNRMLSLDGRGLPAQLQEAIIGMKKGESKEVNWTEKHEHEGHEHSHDYKLKVTVNTIKKAVVPELTDDFVKTGYGFDTVDAFMDAVREEIANDKQNTLPILKEERALAAATAHLELDELPAAYVDQVFNEIVNQFLSQLSAQGLTLDSYLSARDIAVNDFIEDMRTQAEERARQSLTLDALAAELKLEASEDDIRAEFERAGSEDVDAMYEDFKKNGRLPAVREGVRRSKALDWLVENAKVTEVDEIARRHAESEKKTAPKKSSKATAKSGAKSGAKKTTATKKSTSSQKSAKKDAE